MKYLEPIEFYASEEIKVREEDEHNVYSGRLTPQDLKKYSPASRKIMENMGFDYEEPTGLNHGKGIQIPIGIVEA